MYAYSVMVYLLIITLLSTGFLVWFYIKHIKIKSSTARKIEIFGYFLLFTVLIWELWIKGVLMSSFYKADFYYISEKLHYILDMLQLLNNTSTMNESEILTGFYNAQQSDYVKVQMEFVDKTEAIIKIVSTVCIAIGRFQELREKESHKVI